ncbi:MAG: hypothetical protein HY905_14655 [Deltaproteobacteria bacterium]|nr:hypothetical protein [Deltaproteobacteria bacterium]
MEFTFWESKSVKLPKGPLYASLAFMVALGLIGLLGQWAGSLAGKKEMKFSGATLPELTEWEKTVSGGDVAKIDELLQKEGGRIGADMNKWGLISKWNNGGLLKLYQDDLLLSLRSQIDALKKAEEAAKAAKNAPAAGEAPPAEAPAAPAKP